MNTSAAAGVTVWASDQPAEARPPRRHEGSASLLLLGAFLVAAVIVFAATPVSAQRGGGGVAAPEGSPDWAWGCTSCRKAWPSDQKFCGDCGKPNVERHHGCPACRKFWPTGQKFCGDCGKPNAWYAAAVDLLEPGDVVKVGAVLELSGGIATYGEETRHGVELALEDLKQQKLPWTLDIVWVDNKSDANETKRAVEQLIKVNKVTVIIGAIASKNTMAGARSAQHLGVPMISPGSTNVNVTKVGDCISRVCYIDDFQGEVMARFAFHNLGKRQATLVVDTSQDYCVGLGQAFKETFEREGGKIVSTENYTSGQPDFSALITKVRQTAPEVIFIPGYYGEVGPMLKQASEAWAGIPKLGGDGWDSPAIFDLAGMAGLKDTFISSHYAPDDPDPKVKAFVERYRKRFNKQPGSMSVLGYDTIIFLVDAIKRANSTDPQKIKEAINATRGLKGTITGDITLDENRNPQKEAVILKLDVGAFKFHARSSGVAPSAGPQ